MKVAMISPSKNAEAAISNFSEKLVEAIRKSGVEIDNLTYTAGSPKTFFKLLPSLKNYDIVHIQHEFNLLGWKGIPFFFVYLFLMLFKKYKIITTMHTALSLNEKFMESPFKSFLRKTLYLTQTKFIDNASDFIVVHQDFYRDNLKEYEIDEKKVITLRQGIIEDVKLIPKAQAKKELNLLGPVYLMIGSLKWDNGSDIILKQADKIGKTILVATNPGAVNTRDKGNMGNWIKHLQEIVKKNKFEKFVRFDLKELPFELWWKYFSAADIILQPYRINIGSGIFTDAMATGKPIVAKDTLFFKEIGENYGCVKTAKEEDFPKIIKESMDPKNYEKMVEESKRYLKENSWTSIGKKYKEFYNSIK